MKTQIVVSSFSAASFEVLPWIVPQSPGMTPELEGGDVIDWLAGLARRQRPARRLPGATLGVTLRTHRVLHHPD
jgi:hypothetical protein